jgi:hypothetical protein
LELRVGNWECSILDICSTVGKHCLASMLMLSIPHWDLLT